MLLDLSCGYVPINSPLVENIINVKCIKCPDKPIRKVLKNVSQPGAVAHACNPSTLGGQGGWITWGYEFQTSLANMANLVSTKNIKISQVWQHTPVIPATWEAETGESLEAVRPRLQWAEIAPLCSSLGNRAKLHLKEKKKSKSNHDKPRCYFLKY